MKGFFNGSTFRILSICFMMFALFGCETMEDMLDDAASDLVKSTSSSQTGGSVTGKLDFKDDEVLALWDGKPPDDGNFLLAKILTPASEATKGEAEFLFVDSGEVKWTSWYFNSRIPEASELELGMTVLYPYNGMAHFGDLDERGYRTSWWYTGRITDLDELYKDVVGINGDAFQLAGVRLAVE